MADIKTKTTVLSVDVNDAVRRTGEYKTKIDELRRSLQGLKEDSEEYNRVARELNETIAGLNASLNSSSSGNMDKLGRSLQNVSAQVNDTTKTIQNSNLAGRIAELRQQMNEAGEFSSVKEYKEYLDLLKASLLNLDESSEEYTATANELRDAQDRLNRVMQASKGYADAADGSYNQLVRTMSDLKRQWRATADETERAEIGRKILDINNQLKEMDASIGNYQRNVGDYQNAFEEAFKVVLRGIGANSSALGHLSSQIIQMIPMIKKTIQVATTGMKGIKAALASTGIGLLVVALGEVVAHWNDIVGLVTGATARQKEYTRAVKETAAAIGNLDYANEQLEHELEMKLREMKRNGATEVQMAKTTLEYENKALNNAAKGLNKAKGDFMNAMAKEGRNTISIKQLQEVLGDEFSSDKVQKALGGTGMLVVEEAKKVNKSVISQIDGIVKEYDKWEKAVRKVDKAQQDLLDAQSGKNGTPGGKKTKTEIEIKFDGVDSEFAKLEKETEDYLDWYVNEYEKSEEEVRVHRIEKQAKALEELKHKEWQAVEDNIAAKKKEVKEKREAGEISEEEAQAKYKEIEEEGIKAKEKINERYRNLRTRLDVKNAAEAAVEMNKIYLSRAQELFNQINNGWSKSYEKQIYDTQRLNDAFLKLNKKNYKSALDSFLPENIQLFDKNTFGIYESDKFFMNLGDKLGEIVIKGVKTREELEEQLTKFFKNAGQISELGWVDVLSTSKNDFTLTINDWIKTEDELGYQSEMTFARVTNAVVSLNGKLRSLWDNLWGTGTEYGAFKEAVEDYYKLINTPPKHISNYFDDDETRAYYENLLKDENEVYKARKANLEDIKEGLEEQLAKMTEGSEEYVQTQQMIADTETEIDDLKTEHIINNIDLIDEREEKLKDNREKRWEWWMDNMAGVSSTLDNLGNIFQNELKREVEAGKISEEVAKDRFESLKALNYASVVMDTASAIMKVWKTSSDMPQPFGSIWGGIQTAALATQGILQLQQIKNQQFSASSSETPGVTATPTQADYFPQYVANETSNTELTRLTNAMKNVRPLVSITDIEDVEKLVEDRDAESTY